MRVNLRAAESYGQNVSFWEGVTVKTTPTELEDLLGVAFGPQAMGVDISMITIKYADSDTMFRFDREVKEVV